MNKDPTTSISPPKDLATSFHVNPTFKEAQFIPISNALDLKKHTAVTFQEKLDIKSKPKGCVSSKFVRVLWEYNREHRPDLISLLETRVSGEKADLVIAKLGFNNSHHVEAVVFSRGIWIGWKYSVNMEVLQGHPQFVLANVSNSSLR
ncbi:hypothetical protein PVK06_016290 [Gossypium arboreum]|uniref:Uncharacterized protein n=1 Tax=Gossypium arboreum TaxID=29729 RepID=A0ABR0Q0F8_GOSAR|nr:hypothetical protein PVK06_016290 [Gossypium arboreum]